MFNIITSSLLQIAEEVVSYGASQVVRVIKNSFASAGDEKDMGSIPGLGRSPGGGHGNLLLCSYLENPMDRAAWWATVHWSTRTHTYTHTVD